jgi:plastocyanin
MTARGAAAALAALALLAAAAPPVPPAPAAPPPGPALRGVVRDAQGNALRDAVVYLPEAAPAPGRGPTPAATLDQRDRRFVPLGLVVRVGTRVRFPNSEAIRHNVYSFSRAKPFEIGLFRGQGGEVTLDRPGEVKVFCSIHKRMGALIVVLDHPYAAVTDAEGRFAIPGVRAGTHAVRAAHVFSLGATRPIAVGPAGARADFDLAVAAPPGESDAGGY